MTVAAVVLAASPESALADADGLPGVRRIAESAWSGGAMPVVVVSDDPDGAVARALAGTEATLAEPPATAVGQPARMAHGIGVALARVDATDAVLLWPTRMTWVGPETVTSLIEGHGADPASLLRPAYAGAAGWPILLPAIHADRLLALAADRMPDDVVAELVAAGVPIRMLDLGDPGTVIDAATPRADLPSYEGPAPDLDRRDAEWGAAAADIAEEAPLAGPSVAPAPEG